MPENAGQQPVFIYSKLYACVMQSIPKAYGMEKKKSDLFGKGILHISTELGVTPSAVILQGHLLAYARRPSEIDVL